MVRIATEKRLPFEPLMPNDQTIDALMTDLSADDYAYYGLQARLQTREPAIAGIETFYMDCRKGARIDRQ